MKIDLMALAKQADETYLDVDCTFGKVRVYHVPDAALFSGQSIYSEPDQPVVIMKTLTGTQERPIKKGEDGYDEWWNEVIAIREKQFEIRQARGYVFALKDIDWLEYDISKPPTFQAQDIYNGHWPEEEMLRKKIWLDFTVLRIREDKDKVLEAINSMNRAYEPTEEMIEEVKKNSV
jgi:hypothetical protein